MSHIRDQQTEKDMQFLDLSGQSRSIHSRPVQQLIYGVIHLADLHDVDAA